MIDCWQENPSARPTFEGLRDQMKSFERDHQVGVRFCVAVARQNTIQSILLEITRVFFELTHLCNHIICHRRVPIFFWLKLSEIKS